MTRVLVLLALLLTASCVDVGGGEDAAMTVSPAVAPFDEPVGVRITGLGAGRETTVSAETTDYRGTRWSATAEFRADRDGTLDLATPPESGAYTGGNPMGLFEFMTPAGGDATFFGQPTDEPAYEVRLTASVAGRQVAAATATRLLPLGLGVTTRPLTLATDGVVGALHRPKDTSARKPALLVFGGSEGGLSFLANLEAQVWAAHGYPTLALAYFKAPGLPQTLTGIPLEYFRTALEILRRQPGVDPAHVLVDGPSYGGEAALLVAATYPDLVGGVIARSPNSYVSPGPGGQNRSAWSLGGRDLPRGRFGVPAAEVEPGALIPVGRIRGPILLTCGALDTEWPACRNVDDAVARLGKRPGVSVARYPNAGHYVGGFVPYTPVTEAALTRDGSGVPGTLAATADVHRRILALLAAQ